MLIPTSKLAAIARALGVTRLAKNDNELELGPLQNQVLDLPEILGRIGRQNNNPEPDSSWNFTFATGQVGAGAAVNRAIPGPGIFLKPGLWRFRGFVLAQYVAAAPPTPLGSVSLNFFDTNDPANSFLVAGINTTNPQTQLVVPFDFVWMLSNLRGDGTPTQYQFTFGVPATVGGETIIAQCSIAASRYF